MRVKGSVAPEKKRAAYVGVTLAYAKKDESSAGAKMTAAGLALESARGGSHPVWRSVGAQRTKTAMA